MANSTLGLTPKMGNVWSGPRSWPSQSRTDWAPAKSAPASRWCRTLAALQSTHRPRAPRSHARGPARAGMCRPNGRNAAPSCPPQARLALEWHRSKSSRRWWPAYRFARRARFSQRNSIRAYFFFWVSWQKLKLCLYFDRYDGSKSTVRLYSWRRIKRCYTVSEKSEAEFFALRSAPEMSAWIQGKWSEVIVINNLSNMESSKVNASWARSTCLLLK